MIAKPAPSAVFVSSAGGVLLDPIGLAEAWAGPITWVAADAPDTRQRLAGLAVDWVEEPSSDDPVALVAETRRARACLKRQRPDWVVSAGTALAVPWFVAAKSLRIPSLWIETLNIHGQQGRAAIICSRLAERVLVQRSSRLIAHRRSVLVGELY